MALTYLQIFADMAELIEPLNDEERGRLLTAMMDYAFRGEEPVLIGNERYIWPVFRRAINQSESKIETKKANASKNKRTEAKPSESAHEQEQEHEHEQEQEQREDARGDAREAAPSAAACPDGDDGSELTELIENQRRAERLMSRFGLTDNEVTLEALLEDAERTSWQSLEEALKKASESDNRGGISVRFYRAILNGSGGRQQAGSDPYAGVPVVNGGAWRQPEQESDPYAGVPVYGGG